MSGDFAKSGSLFQDFLKKKSGAKPDFDPVAIVSAYWQQTVDCHSEAIKSLLSQVAEVK